MCNTMLEKAIELRHELHAHPESSMNEVWTKAHVIEFLKSNASKLEVVDCGKWFYAKYTAGESKREPIAFRADFDAVPVEELCKIPYASQVPGLAHKCGHDGHTATLAYFATVLNDTGADRDVYLLFQPGEETGEGALYCVPMITENNIGEIYCMHNDPRTKEGTLAIIEGTIMCASMGFIITMEGKKSHASEPEKGINPAFALSETVMNIPRLIDPATHRGMVLCTVIRMDVGEEAFGTSAGFGRLMLTIRGYYEDEMMKLKEDLIELTTRLANEQGLKVSYNVTDHFPGTANKKTGMNKVIEAAKRAGIPSMTAEVFRSSDDFGHLLNAAGDGAYFFMGSDSQPPLHTNYYNFPDHLIEKTAKVYAELVKM